MLLSRQGALHRASALATTLLPEHPVPEASRSTIAHSKFSVFCLDRSSWVCSDGCLEELRIGRIGEVGTHRSWHNFDTSAEMMIEYQELVTGKGIGIPPRPSAFW